jgi:excisionase family DNA binding protein
MTSRVTMDIQPGFLRREDAARFLGVSLRTLAEWQSEHRIPYAKMSHRVCLFKVADLEKCIDRLTVKAAGG